MECSQHHMNKSKIQDSRQIADAGASAVQMWFSSRGGSQRLGLVIFGSSLEENGCRNRSSHQSGIDRT